ncbi:MAG: DUF4004 family protein [Clostridia bacterium]|nr:DUF4004 family protein [Clostridia bacterium]
MNEELISKKELLEKYGISYGALYRWKRKGLIPEEWFIRRSTVTGQETFFVRDVICARVEMILSGKDEASLDEMARQFGAAEKKDSRRLVLRMKYGERSIMLSDMESAVLLSDSGEEKDITDLLRELLKKV